jgi:hypothetical protein
MRDTTHERMTAALTLCAATIPMLKRAWRLRVMIKLRQVQRKVETGSLEKAFKLYRRLPREVVDLKHARVIWMKEGTSKTTPDQNAVLAAYYRRTLKAIGDLRVHVLYGFERPIVDTSSESLVAEANELLRQPQALLPTKDSWYQLESESDEKGRDCGATVLYTSQKGLDALVSGLQKIAMSNDSGRRELKIEEMDRLYCAPFTHVEVAKKPPSKEDLSSLKSNLWVRVVVGALIAVLLLALYGAIRLVMDILR